MTYSDMQKAAKAKTSADGSMDEIRAYLLANEVDGKATVLNKLTFQDESNISGQYQLQSIFCC